MYPHERSLVKRLESKPFALIGVNSDENREELAKAMIKENITWRSWWDGGSVRGPIAARWNVSAWPAIYILDGKGVIRDKYVIGAEAMDRAVDKLLKELEDQPRSLAR
jgi:hypothetical protein